MTKVAFEMKDGVTSVTVEVQGRDESVVVDKSPFSTEEPEVIRALDESPGLKRVAKKAGG